MKLLDITCFVVNFQVMPTDNVASHKSSRNATVTSLIVCCGFVVCWSVTEIMYFLRLVGYHIPRNNWYTDFSLLLVYINSCINPFIYAAKYGEFQNGMRRMVAHLTGKPLQNTESGQVVSQPAQASRTAVT